MSAIDTRVVEAKFKNDQFSQGVSDTLSALDRLKSALHLDGAANGLKEVSKAAGSFDSSAMEHGVGRIAGSFSAMQAAAFGAFASIGAKAVSTATQMAGAFTTAPITAGFDEYELKMGSIQTILANTQRHGTTLETVNAEFEKLNAYADQTIYNFGDMTRNVGLFTAAGIKVEDATTMIKGFSNAAATTGTSAADAAGAARQLSQSLGDGKITLETWNSLSNAGMGNKNMQDSLVQLADKMGTFAGTGASAESATKSFNKSLEKGWLAPDVMSTYLKIMSGDMDDAAIAALGFSAAEVKGFRDQANMGNDAAKKVRTFTQLMGTLKEAIGSGWSETFGILFGDFNEATDLFTNISESVGNFVGNMSKSRNELLTQWKDFGGRTALIKGLGTAFQVLSGIISPIGDAFRRIFPKTTASELYRITVAFWDLMIALKPSQQTMDNISRTAAGLFAILHIGWTVIKTVAQFLGRLTLSLSDGSSGILGFTGSIGDFLVGLDKAISSGKGLTSFFDTLYSLLMKIITPISNVVQVLGSLTDNFDVSKFSGVTDEFGQMGDKLKPLASIGEKLSGVFEYLGRVFSNIGKKIGNALGGIGQAIVDNFSLSNFDRVIDLLNTGLFAVLTLSLKKFLANFGKGSSPGTSFLTSIKDSLEALTGTMEAMQTKLKADALLGIAVAVGVMAAALLVLSLIDADALAKSLVAMAIGFGIMAAGMTKLSASIGLIGSLKLPLIAASLTLIAGSLLLMALAMKTMASMELGDMLRGLFGMGAALSVVAGAMRLMPKGMTLQAVALMALGLALNEIALAMKLFATISWEEMGRGLAAMAGSLTAIAFGMRLMPKGILLQAVALNALATSLGILAGVMKLMGLLSWEEMGRGMVGIAGSLVLIAGAMRLMPKNMLIQAVALNAVAVSLNVIALALMAFSSMSWEDIGKGLVTLGGAMLILAGGLNLMSGTLMGSAAMVIATGALAVLVPILITMGTLSWGTIIKGLTMLAGVFTILGLAGLLLAPVLPIILGLAAAMVLIGAGLLAAGAGALLFSTGFAALIAVASTSMAVIGGLIAVLINAIPPILAAVAQGLVAMVNVIVANGPAFYRLFKMLLENALKAIREGVPKIINLFLTLVINILGALERALPLIVQKGANIIISLLSGIAKNLPKIIDKATDVIVAFINGIARNLPRIIESGIKLIISFVNGIANGIRSHAKEMGEAGANLATAIVEGMIKGIAGGVGKIVDAAKNLAKSAWNAAKDFLGIHSPSRKFIELGRYTSEGFAIGLVGNKEKIQDAVKTMMEQLTDAMTAANSDVAAKSKKVNDLLAQRIETIRAIAAAKADLARANAREVGSTAKTASARAAEIKREQAAKDSAIRAAQERLRKLNATRSKQDPAIRAAQAARKEATSERTRLAAAQANLKRQEHMQQSLEQLADKNDVLTEKVKEATKALEDATKTRDDYNKSLFDTYGAQQAVNKDTKRVDYIKGLQQQIVDTQNFTIAIQELRKRGLNDDFYKQLLASGTESMPFIQELLSGGQGAVDEINTLGASLDKAASVLGKGASTSLYQAGVDAAAGLLKGLENQQANIEAQMDRIAKYMVASIKKSLGIRSPSRVFAELGGYSAEGLAKGLADSSAMVGRSAEGLGQTAIDSMKKTISGLGDLISGDMDLNPVITPVLDLSTIRKDASGIGSLLGAQPLSFDSTYSRASAASAGYVANQQALVETGPTEAPAPITFIQNNTSPKSLSHAELYRQTNNQISVAKGALTSNARSGRST